MLKVICTVFAHNVISVSYIIHNGIPEEDIVFHLVDIELIHTVKDAVYMGSQKIASGEEITVIICFFSDSLSLDVIAFKKEKYTDEGNT